MSVQSDAAKRHIEGLLRAVYGMIEMHHPTQQKTLDGQLPQQDVKAFMEYRFDLNRKWRLDYAVPSILCANAGNLSHIPQSIPSSIIELQGGLFVKGAHSNPNSLRNYYEKMNAAASKGWRVWQYAPEQVIKAGRKGKATLKDEFRLITSCVTLPDEPILRRLPWITERN